MAAMLLTTACSSDEDVATTIGGESEVTFAVQLPADVQARSRAEYGEGNTALNLVWQVYDEAGTKLNVQGTTTFTNRVATVTMRLANSRKYNVLFWASANGCPYTFDADTKTVTATYAAVTAQDEAQDAFFARYEMPAAVSGTITQPVQLYRPFAQINIGATDYAAAAAAGWVTEDTRVTVSNVYTKLNLFDGTVSDPVQVVYGYAAQPDNTYAFPLAVDADYQAMVYTLTASESALVDVKFEAKDGGEVITRDYANVPVKRNYRTNIYGSILTEAATFNVQIVPGFQTPANDYAVPDPGTAMVNGVQYSTLQEAVNAVTGTNVDVTIGAGSYTMPTIAQNTEVTLKGQGAGVTTMTYYNLTGNYGSFSVENMTFNAVKTSGTYVGVIHTADVTFTNAHVVGQLSTYASNFKAVNTTFENTTNYAVHVYGVGTATFEGCTFKSHNGKAVLCYDESAVQHNMIFTNCTFTSSVARDDKAPVQMHTEYGTYGTLTMTGCTATGFGDPHHNGDLWNDINNRTDVATTNFTVKVEGTVVQTAH